MPKANLLISTDRQALLSRIAKIKPDARPRWGKMNVHEMIVHCADQLRIATGHLPAKDSSDLFHRTLAKWVILAGFPFPRGVYTMAEIDQKSNQATNLTEFQLDKENLIQAVNDLLYFPEDQPMFPHPYFGHLTHHEWGRLGWLHINHHLRQFGR